ncbi:MAG: hypothetical protein U9R00_00910, partial [Patescibacteria group bacterium]|nr:hypothetical protein [Patescibacteria group bacterium]
MKRLYCLLLVVILLVGCASVPRTEANKRLVEFPEEIPGVSTVVKIEVKEAKHCLVHIGQQHWTSGMEDLALLEVMETQDEIYTILLYLRENILLREVYQEGNKEDVDNSRNLEEEHNIHVDFLLAKLSEMVEPDVLEGVKNDLKKNDEEYKEYCQNNALGRLKKEGKMVLK